MPRIRDLLLADRDLGFVPHWIRHGGRRPVVVRLGRTTVTGVAAASAVMFGVVACSAPGPNSTTGATGTGPRPSPPPPSFQSMFTDTVSVNGSITVTCSDSTCAGYQDISPMAQATLVNENNTVVAETNLVDVTPASSATADKRYTFTFTGVPPAQRYGVHVGNVNRGTIWEDSAEATATGFSLSLGG